MHSTAWTILAGPDRARSTLHRRQLATSSIAFAEVMWGTANGRLPAMADLDGFATEVPILPFDEVAARRYADLSFKHGNFDRLIAAHALSLDMVLVTDNEADSTAIPGLAIENWTR